LAVGVTVCVWIAAGLGWWAMLPTGQTVSSNGSPADIISQPSPAPATNQSSNVPSSHPPNASNQSANPPVQGSLPSTVASAPKRGSAQPKLQLVINCQTGPMPSQIPPEPDGLWVLDLTNQFTSIGRYFTLKPGGGETNWGVSKHSMSERCEVTNYNGVVLHDVALQLRMRRLAVVTEGNAQRSGGVQLDQVTAVHLPNVIADNGRFTFHIWSRSESFVQAWFLAAAVGKVLGDEGIKEINVVLTGTKEMSFSPRQP
jgi:hypothetical protein